MDSCQPASGKSPDTVMQVTHLQPLQSFSQLISELWISSGEPKYTCWLLHFLTIFNIFFCVEYTRCGILCTCVASYFIFFPVFHQTITTFLEIMWMLMFPFWGYVPVRFIRHFFSPKCWGFFSFRIPSIKLQCLIQYWDLISSWCESAHGEIWHPSESGRHQYEGEICSSKFEEINFTAQTYDSSMLCLQPWLLHNEEHHIHMIWCMRGNWTDSSLYGNIRDALQKCVLYKMTCRFILWYDRLHLCQKGSQYDTFSQACLKYHRYRIFDYGC